MSRPAGTDGRGRTAGLRPPGLLEVATAVVAYLAVVHLVGAPLLGALPEDSAVLRGWAGFALSGLAPALAFGLALLPRWQGWRRARLLGLRAASWRWVALGAASVRRCGR